MLCCVAFYPIVAINNTTNTSHRIPIITIVVFVVVLLHVFSSNRLT